MLAVPVSGPALAQEWPTRNVTVVVPLGAGSATDIASRIVMDQVSRQTGQAFVIENRTGAGGTIGAGMVAKSAPDGYTVLSYGALSISNALHSKLSYDAVTDFIPVVPFGHQPLLIVTSPAKGYKTVGDLIATAKAKPGAMNFSSAGVGSASHFGAERFRASAGIEAQHIPTKGAVEAATEILSGRVDFSASTSSSTVALISDGKLVPLVVSAHKRSPVVPDVPTMIEAGLRADSVYPFYSALYLPAKTPRDIVEKLHREVAKALQAPAVQERFAKLGIEPMPMDVKQFGEFFRDDVMANAALVKAANIPTQ
jgi:tripartite-type tricarboxylate transporter receptor subunit TctC